MKTIILLMAVTVMTANVVSASPVTSLTVVQKAKPTPEERAKSEVKKLTELLTLSADQASRITTAAVQKYKDQNAIRKNHKGDEQAIKAETKKVQAKYASQLKQILSPEQQAKLKAHRAKMNGKRKKKQ